MNTGHLNDTHWSELMTGTADESTRQHLEACAACRVEFDRLQSGACQVAESMRARAERDEVFWSKQRAAIRMRARRGRNIAWLRYASTAIAALLLVAALLFTRTPKLNRAASPQPADEVLLQQVEADIGRDAPRALSPATPSDDQQ